MLGESFEGEKIEPIGESNSASSQVGLLFGFKKVQALEDEAKEEKNDGEGGLRKVHLFFFFFNGNMSNMHHILRLDRRYSKSKAYLKSRLFW